MTHFRALLAILLFSAASVQADSFEFAVSNDSVQASYEVFLSNSFSTKASLLYADVERAKIDFDGGGKSKLDTETTMLSWGLFNNGKTGIVRTHLGGQLFWIDPDIEGARHGKDNTFGIALGGAIDAYIIPQLFVMGSLLYSPDILTSGGYKSYLEFNTRISWQVLKNTALFAGYRHLEVESDKLEAELFSGLLFGFKFSF